MARQPNTIYPLSAMMSEYNLMKNKDSNRHILQTVLCNTREISQMNLDAAAAFCHVSPSTMLRFCKEMQFSSFTEFKLRLKAESERYINKYQMPFPDDEAQLLDAMVSRGTRLLDSWRAAIDHDACVRLVEQMHTAQKVFFFDICYSQSRIQLQNHLAHTGKRVYFSADLAEQLEYLAEADAQSVIVIDTHAADRDVNAQQLLLRAIDSPAFVATILQEKHAAFFRRSDLSICYSQDAGLGAFLAFADELTYLYLAILYANRYLFTQI